MKFRISPSLTKTDSTYLTSVFYLIFHLHNKVPCVRRKETFLAIFSGSQTHAFVPSHPSSDFHCFRQHFIKTEISTVSFSSEKKNKNCIFFSIVRQKFDPLIKHHHFLRAITESAQWERSVQVSSLRLIIKRKRFCEKKTNFSLRKNMIQPPIEKIFHPLNGIDRALFD